MMMMTMVMKEMVSETETVVPPGSELWVNDADLLAFPLLPPGWLKKYISEMCL